MSWEAIAASVAGNLLGGMFGEDRNEDNLNAARMQAERNEALQREFAQHGIRWRVEDAKAAGLHPLFALQGGGAAFAPNPITVGGASSMAESMRGMGQDVSRAIMAQATDLELAERAARIKLLEAQARAADRSNPAVVSGGSVGTTGGMYFPSVDMNTPGEEMSWPLRMGAVSRTLQDAVGSTSYTGDEAVSVRGGDSSVTANVHGGWSEYDLGGLKMELPSKAMSEPMESMSESIFTMAAVITHNVNKFGPAWLHDFSKKFVPGYGPGVEVIRQSLDLLDDRVKRWAYGAIEGSARNRVTGRIRRSDEVPYRGGWPRHPLE